MSKIKPVNLQLQTIKFPCTAISSILHRISGLILFLCIPLLLLGLESSLHSQVSFDAVKQCLTSPLCKLIVWGVLSALLYHLVAGIRHLLMDAGLGESKAGGRKGAYAVLFVSAILITLVGLWIW